ncbi:MAG: GTPase, partial [Myxococcota bacterium]
MHRSLLLTLALVAGCTGAADKPDDTGGTGDTDTAANTAPTAPFVRITPEDATSVDDLVVVIDTPGFDDTGPLGELRVKRTRDALNRCDIAVLVADGTLGLQPADQALLEMIRARSLPHLIAWN